VANQSFSFMLDCDESERHKKFEIGYIVIAALDSIIILGVALHSRVWSYTFRGTELGIIMTWKWALPAVLILGGIGALALQLGYFTKTVEIFGATVSAICLIVCTNELLFLIKCARRPVLGFVRICDLISVPFSLVAVTLVKLFT
jgi:hypothetical protein